jgi:hypothetical protein
VYELMAKNADVSPRQRKSERQIIQTDNNQHSTTRNQQQPQTEKPDNQQSALDTVTRQPTNNYCLIQTDTPDNQKPKLDNQQTSYKK